MRLCLLINYIPNEHWYADKPQLMTAAIFKDVFKMPVLDVILAFCKDT